jgi:NADH-quinone oxidoreductase subunit F
MSTWKTYQPVILPPIANLHQIDTYVQNGGYEMLRETLTGKFKDRKTLIDTVKAANIRGRGGAGFNAGLKWSFMPPKQAGVPRYLACNGDESEPGTYKDRRIFEFNPHLFIEGAIIACYAMEMDAAYVYIRGEYADWIDMLQKAVDDAYAKGFLGKNILGSGVEIHMHLHKGAGAYICGEETSLMESLEGKRAYPRSKPPFPAQFGLWGKPTTINNIETLAHVPLVLKRGPEWYAGLGAKDHPGPFLYGIQGHVNKPGLYELPSGVPLAQLIYEVAGGPRNGKKIKAVVPGGASVPVLPVTYVPGDGDDAITHAGQRFVLHFNGHPGITMNNASLDTARREGESMGSMVGTTGMLVLDEDTDMVRFLHRVAKFYNHESCGQCTPCREGTGWLVKLLAKFERGTGDSQDLELLLDLCDNMEGRTVCALADAAAWPVRNTIRRFRNEFEARVVAKPMLVMA